MPCLMAVVCGPRTGPSAPTGLMVVKSTSSVSFRPRQRLLLSDRRLAEGVNLNAANQITLHTGPSCLMNEAANMVGNLVGNTCTSSNGANAGCAVGQSGNNSFGHGFNEQAGGVYAHLWNDDAIQVWFFPRGQIPADITAKNPNPSSWGTPTANFPSQSSCQIGDHFQSHQLVIDTTLCGDWAGAAFGQDGCSGSCSDFVADPANFQSKFPLSALVCDNN